MENQMKNNKQNVIMLIFTTMWKLFTGCCKAAWSIIKLGIGIR
jgi:hypothetical protein